MFPSYVNFLVKKHKPLGVESILGETVLTESPQIA